MCTAQKCAIDRSLRMETKISGTFSGTCPDVESPHRIFDSKYSSSSLSVAIFRHLGIEDSDFSPGIAPYGFRWLRSAPVGGSATYNYNYLVVASLCPCLSGLIY